MKIIKKDNGITLLALVITIIILLILAGITLSQLTGSGLFEKVEQAKEKSEETEKEQDNMLNEYAVLIDEKGINRNESKLIVRFANKFDKYIYIDSNNGNDSTGDGSREKPYATLGKIATTGIIENEYSYGIILKEGTYELTKEIFNLNCNQSINIIGKKEKTVLKVNGIYSNYSGGKSTYKVNFYRLIWNGNNTTAVNTIYPSLNMNINAVVFINIASNSYSYFMCNTNCIIKMNNCTMPKQALKMLRTTPGKIELTNCYGGFTSGYGTVDSNWNYQTNYITSTPQVDENYRITEDESKWKDVGTGTDNDGSKADLGVYGGEYSWEYDDDI